MRIIRVIATSLLIALFITSQGQTDVNSLTASDKSFFEQARKAILAEDVKWFSGAVSYPIILKLGKKEIKLESKKEIEKQAASIFTDHLKSVLREQSSDSLFKNWQGVMVGNGEMWFSQVAETNETGKVWMHRITRMNLPERQSKEAK